MLSIFRRGFLLVLLAFTGMAAILIALGVYRTRSPIAVSWAFECAIALGLLMLVSFAAYTALDRPHLRPMAIAGMLLASVMLALLPLLAWWQMIHLRPLRSQVVDPVCQLAISGFETALLLCLIPFVLIPSMKRVGRIVQFATILYLFVAYLTTLLYVWRIDTQRIEDLAATLLIPAGACMMGVFAMHKFFSVSAANPFTSVGHVVHICCPRCHSNQVLGLGESRCSQCRLHIAIAVEEPRCPNCSFNLYGLSHPVCPECGLHLDQEDVPRAAPGGAAGIKPADG